MEIVSRKAEKQAIKERLLKSENSNIIYITSTELENDPTQELIINFDFFKKTNQPKLKGKKKKKTNLTQSLQFGIGMCLRPVQTQNKLTL